MVRVAYPPHVAARLKKLRKENWSMQRQVAEPLYDLVLYRNGLPLPAQEVIVTFVTSGGRPFASSASVVLAGSVETLATVRIRRRIEDGFDAVVGDRFEIDGMTGDIQQITQDIGYIWASGKFDTGTP